MAARHPFQPDAVCVVLPGTDLAGAHGPASTSAGAHVLTPLTGGAATGARSVMVVGTDLGEADVLATAALPWTGTALLACPHWMTTRRRW